MVDGHLNFDTKINTQGFTNGLSGMTKAAESLKGSFLKLGAVIAGAFSGREIIEAAAGVKALNSQFEQTFGSLQGQAQALINGVADSSQILESRLKKTATGIYAFAKTSGMDSASALNMMNEALQVTADSAAYYDRSIEETAETLQSFLKGNFANDAALGLSATETTRNIAANKLYAKSFQELSESQKQLTLLQMVKDANALSGAMGQAAREADGWENVTGNLKEAWKQLLAVIGQPVLALAVPLVKQLTDGIRQLASLAQSVSAAFAKVFGTAENKSVADTAKAAADSYSDMADAAEAAQEANEGSLAAFDEINKISDDTAEQSGIDGLADEETAGGVTLAVSADTADADERITAFLMRVKSGLEAAKDRISEIFGRLGVWLSDNFGGVFEGIFSELSAEGEELLGTFSQIWNDMTTLAEPLKSWISADLVPYWQAEFTTLGNIATGLFDSVNKVFSDIWSVAVFPVLQNFVTEGLPMITQFGTQMWTSLDTLFLDIKTLFDKLWSEYAAPVLGLLTEIWTDTVSILKAKWDEYGAPIFEGLRNTFDNVTEQLRVLLDEWIKPLFDYLMQAAGDLWNGYLAPLIDNILGLVGDIILAAQKIYNKAIAPLIRWVTLHLAPVVQRIGRGIVDGVSEHIKKVIAFFNSIVTFLRDIFKGDFSKALAGIREVFKSGLELTVTVAKEPLNALIALINALISGVSAGLNFLLDGVESLVNSLSDAVNSLSFDIPDWVPGVGGQTLSFDMPYINIPDIAIPEIPRLAQGTVVPANYGEFLAVLGDNRREAEVVSPVSAIKQAVMEAMVALDGGGSKQPVIVKVFLNGREIGQAAIDDINDRTKRNGRSPLK